MAAKGRRFEGMYSPAKVEVTKTYKMKAVKETATMKLKKSKRRPGLSGNLPKQGIGGFSLPKSWSITSKKFNRTLNGR